MKIIISNTSEKIALDLKHFFKNRGYEVQLLTNDSDPKGDIKFSEVKEKGLPDCDAIINFPQIALLDHKKGSQSFEKEFFKTRIEPTLFLKESLLKAKNPPKVWISFSSVGIYPKEENKLYRESDPAGEDYVAKLMQKWEEAAKLPEDCAIRSVAPRLGLVLSPKSGLLSRVMPIFRMGFGVTIGEGTEAFPWIYQKDVFWFLDFALHQDGLRGVFNTVAPQLINSSDFSKALAKVMQKPLWFKLPKSYFRNRFGDTAEIVFAKSKVFPSNLLKTGFEFRYPAIYPALVDSVNRGS